MFSSDDEDDLFSAPTKFQPEIMKPNTDANMIFSPTAKFDASAVCQNYGQASTLHTGKGVEVAVVYML